MGIMGLPLSFARVSGGLAYADKIKGVQPDSLIAYWPLWEEGGSTADNYEGTAARDGTYTNAVLADQTGPSLGYDAPYFDGSGDYVDVFSASLAAAFDYEEGSVLFWARVSQHIQAEAANRIFLEIGKDSENRLQLRFRQIGSHVLQFRFEGSNTEKSVTVDTETKYRAGWMPFVITWSKSSNQVKFYWDGAQAGSTQLYPQWTGAPTYALIGTNAGKDSSIRAHLAHVAIWTTPLTAAEVALVSTAVGSPQGSIADYYVIEVLGDSDFIALADIDGDGADDIVSGNSTNTAAVHWYENGEAADGKTWTKHVIDDDAGAKIEGITAGDFNGDGEVEVIALDQTGAVLNLYKPSVFGAPSGAWDKVQLQASRPYLQDAVAWDIDGDGRPEIVYAWEGSGAGSGGINWLDWNSGDITNPANWTDYSMVVHEGAWWIARTRLDLNGDGDETDIVFSARDQNNSVNNGIYWIEEPGTVTHSWSETTIESRAGDWTHVDVGDFSGDGTGKDVVATEGDGSLDLCIYRESSSWARSDVPMAHANNCWNVRTMPASWRQNGRDAFIASHISSDAYLYFWDGSAWASASLAYGTAGHPFDDDVVFLDVDGDGEEELVISDSDTYSKVIWIKPAYE